MKMEKEPEIQLKNMKFVNTTWLKHVSKLIDVIICTSSFHAKVFIFLKIVSAEINVYFHTNHQMEL